MSSNWIQAALFPETRNTFNNNLILPTGVDKHNYIALRGKYIWKYNVDNDSWSQIMNASEAIDNWNIGHNETASLSEDRNDLHLYTYTPVGPKLIHIKLENKTHKTFDVTNDFGTDAQSVMIDNSLNIIGGKYNKMHLQWNEKEKQFKNVTVIYNKAKTAGSGLIYRNKPKKSLLLFGGYDYTQGKFIDYGLEFNFQTKKWEKLPIAFPGKWRLSCVLAIKNKFVFTIGGFPGYFSNDIHIYNIKTKTIRLSNIKLPSKAIWKCITVNDELQEEMIVFGYVRNAWNTANISDHHFPPHYLLKIMHSYYLNEFIHILNNLSGEHWKINTLHIL